MTLSLQTLKKQLSGELHSGELMRRLYATDASVYRELPLAIAFPKDTEDIKKLVRFAAEYKTSLIPRAAGTSLAGQCVGNGIVVDCSRFMTKILQLNKAENWVKVQPGVIRDELNAFLKPHGLFFGPNTSTANRCMIGGMVGNNSCGSSSIVYGTTRDHVLELKTVLSDGSEAGFKNISPVDFQQKIEGNSLESRLYQNIFEELSDPDRQKNIRENFPKPSIHRRNTGYAIDALLGTSVFSDGKEDFNFCKLLTGSEGTLAFITEIKLHLDFLPLPEEVVLAVHFNSIAEAMQAVGIIMHHRPDACELMDRIILDCTKDHIEQQKNRYFVEGDPGAILLIELRGATETEAVQKADAIIEDLKTGRLGYAFPVIKSPLTRNVWNLRQAGLGLLANIPGDAKAVACIEDTAVDLSDLPDYIAEFEKLMESFGQQAVYYAHAGAGELHLRPILNLKKKTDVSLFRQISAASASLVKKYRGSLSGEHGDGRVRSEFIPFMIGENNYEILKRIKRTWDPQNIFNPGKIVDPAPMDTSLRYEPGTTTRAFETIFDFSDTQGILRTAEKCNGSGDCRKLDFSGGTMCPSYRATRNEKDTTRARANALREFLTHSDKENPFDHEELYEVLDLCLSCKACVSECPSGVDMATLKAEFLHQYYRSNGIPLRNRAFANIAGLNALASAFPNISNFFLSGKGAFFTKKVLGIAPLRSLPPLHRITLRKWYKKHYQAPSNPRKTVYLFCDEFTNFNDVEIGIKAIQLLAKLNYAVRIIRHPESGRACLSKGMLTKAQRLAIENVTLFSPLVSDESPLVGIEPSAVLGFRDEYPRLVPAGLRDQAESLKAKTFLIDEFISSEIRKGNIRKENFTKEKRKILLHGHCHQKALASVEPSAWMLSLPENYEVEVIPSGCCGMAGSFGYEKEHYDLSMTIGESVLFPAIRKTDKTTIIAAPGTSCRHQIFDGTGRKALHPVEVLWEAVDKL